MTKLEIHDLIMGAIIPTLPKDVQKRATDIYMAQRAEIIANEEVSDVKERK